MSDRNFYIAFQDTENEQIYDELNKVIIWTKVDRRIIDVKTNINDKTWERIR